ncbi:MarR family winged helix-turn-helix transcriptional regulator [Kribbella deserti]|uniref:MarR family winged helix-turn-helix transcriptional regulator n=1 Tax=Kribbella deserti TaxID=1926257 RepID=A0ABV6QDJ6_9ACTN
MKMERPIGYWLKRLDGLLEAAFDSVLAAEELTRRHWQTMNTVRTAPQDAVALIDVMRPFWGPGAITLDETISELTQRGWLAQDDAGRYTLTPAGRAGHASLEEKVHALRSTMLAGLTEDDYRVTVRVLRQMTENLEPATGQEAAKPSRRPLR